MGQTTTATAATLYPFGVPSGSHGAGAPIGVDPHGRPVFYDPLAAKQANLQQAAQLGIVGANGLGKSHLGKLVACGLHAQNVPVVVPNDFKGEWAGVIEQFGGASRRVDQTGGVNLLDPGELIALAAARNADQALIKSLETRRDETVVTVLGIVNKRPLTGVEATIVRTALSYTNPGDTITALPALLDTGRVADSLGVDQGTIRSSVDTAKLAVIALVGSPTGQALGTSGAHQVWDIRNGLAVDCTDIPDSQLVLSAATAATCWTAAQSSVLYYREMIDTSSIFGVVFDEAWRATKYFPALAEQIGGLLRMDRDQGLVTVLLTHSWEDTKQPGGADNILNRCSALAFGGMQQGEIRSIKVGGQYLNEDEQAVLARNSVGGSAGGSARGGVGRFLLKIGSGQGVEVRVVNPPSLPSGTNQRWDGR